MDDDIRDINAVETLLIIAIALSLTGFIMGISFLVVMGISFLVGGSI